MTLAFLGDAVFELLVREYITSSGSMPVNKLHQRAVKIVCASSQCKAVEFLKEYWTEEEMDIFKRGRNATGNHVPKSSHPKEYRAATGLETLFGYLYLKGDIERINELFLLMINNMDFS
ncbi:Mini-ribonuclease 3 [Massilioclostridium coli]|uniref:Mini-ribonuclease 3 n=1 Tax=Massilioclostridium coli TaxID=1870991 RepID=UPI000A402B5E|nr:ribonuclease III domain-containing protein [Massilioclostridium coli]